MSIHSSLRRFQEIARCGSIRAAAERLHLTASALSRELAKLEEELDVTLFERQPRGMVLTEAGRVYLDHARDVLLGTERMRSELEALRGLRRGRVSLLSVEGYAPDFLAHAIADFQSRYPGVAVTLRITSTDGVVEGIASGEADIGLAFSPDPNAAIHTPLRLRAPLLAVMAPDHALAASASLTLADLAPHRLALPDRSIGVRRLIDLQSQFARLRLAPVFEANSLAVLRGFARHGGGVTLLSAMSVRAELEAGLLVAVPLADRLLCEGSIDVCVLAGRSLPVAAAAFMTHLATAAKPLAEAQPARRRRRAGVARQATDRSE